MNPYLHFDPHLQTFALAVIACVVSFCLGWQQAACRHASSAFFPSREHARRRPAAEQEGAGAERMAPAPEPRFTGTIFAEGVERAFNVGATSAEDAGRQLRSFYRGQVKILTIAQKD